MRSIGRRVPEGGDEIKERRSPNRVSVTTLVPPVVRTRPRSLPAVLARQDPRREVAEVSGKVVQDFSPFFRVEERTEVLDYLLHP